MKLSIDHPAPNRASSVLVFFGSLFLYLLLPSHNYLYADDSLGWAFGLLQHDGIINTHHLFLNGLRPIYQSIIADFGIAPERFIAAYCAFWGALGLLALYKLLYFLNCGKAALAGTLVCAFTVGYWTYSIVGDVYVPATAAMILGSYAFLRSQQLESFYQKCIYVAAAIIAFSLMIIHHQAYAWYLGGLVLASVVTGRGPITPRLGYSSVLFILTATITLSIYWEAYSATPNPHGKSFKTFVSGYVDTENYSTEPDQESLSPLMFLKAAAGEIRAIFPYYVMFKSEVISHKVQNSAPYRAVYAYPYMMRSMTPLSVALAMTGIVVAGFTGALLTIKGVYAIATERKEAFFLLLASVPQAIFFIWWLGISDEFWVWSLPFLAMIAAKGASFEFKAKQSGLFRVLSNVTSVNALRACAGGLFVSSLLAGVLIFSDPTSDIDTMNLGFFQQIQSNDLLIGLDRIQPAYRSKIAAFKQEFRYINIFDHAERWTKNDFLSLQSDIQNTLQSGGNIFINPYLSNPPTANIKWIEIRNQNFLVQRDEILSYIKSIDQSRVKWLPLTASWPGYFMN